MAGKRLNWRVMIVLLERSLKNFWVEVLVNPRILLTVGNTFSEDG